MKRLIRAVRGKCKPMSHMWVLDPATNKVFCALCGAQ